MRILRQLVNTKRLFSNVAVNINPIQAQYLSEPCIEVNENDEPIGMISKEDCHINPILHRAFSVFIFDSRKRLVLQKRSSTKITFPGVWTNTCCSHPHYTKLELEMNDDAIGIQRAAYRKLNHELGISPADLGRLYVMGRFIYAARSDDVWSEHEMDYAIVVPEFEGQIRPNREEVSAVELVDRTQLTEMLASSSHKFSPWFTLFASFDWLDLWWNNLDRLEAHKDLKTIHRLTN